LRKAAGFVNGQIGLAMMADDWLHHGGAQAGLGACPDAFIVAISSSSASPVLQNMAEILRASFILLLSASFPSCCHIEGAGNVSGGRTKDEAGNAAVLAVAIGSFMR
jgi:hypothetical protein